MQEDASNVEEQKTSTEAAAGEEKEEEDGVMVGPELPKLKKRKVGTFLCTVFLSHLEEFRSLWIHCCLGICSGTMWRSLWGADCGCSDVCLGFAVF